MFRSSLHALAVIIPCSGHYSSRVSESGRARKGLLGDVAEAAMDTRGRGGGGICVRVRWRWSPATKGQIM